MKFSGFCLKNHKNVKCILDSSSSLNLVFLFESSSYICILETVGTEVVVGSTGTAVGMVLALPFVASLITGIVLG